jgi:hypothetical protein
MVVGILLKHTRCTWKDVFAKKSCQIRCICRKILAGIQYNTFITKFTTGVIYKGMLLLALLMEELFNEIHLESC